MSPRAVTSRPRVILRLLAELVGSRPLRRLAWQRTFLAFQYPNYRLWFLGQLVSLVGTWMQVTAQGYLVFELTHSPAYLGYVGFANGLPSWLFMLYGGVIADRMSRRKLIIITQTTMMLLAFVLAALAFFHLIQPWHIILLAFALGVANAFDVPARQSFVMDLVGQEDLANAIALNGTMFNLATVVGPAVGGVVYALVGPAWCFTINGLSFVAVIVALQLMHLESVTRRTRSTAMLDDLKEGLRYALSTPIIRILIITAAVISFFGRSYATLIPAWAVKVLAGDATTNGWLQSAIGVGAFGGALVIASLGRFKFKGRLLTLGLFILPVTLLLFAYMRWLPLVFLSLAGVGLAFVFIFNLLNASVQTLTPEDLRGRVVSLYTLSFFGLLTLGALWAGWLADIVSEPIAMVINAVVCLIFTLWLWFRAPDLRHLP